MSETPIDELRRLLIEIENEAARLVENGMSPYKAIELAGRNVHATRHNGKAATAGR